MTTQQVHSHRVADDTQRDDEAEPANALSEAVRACLAAGEVAGATTRIVEGYGPQILGFLVALTRCDADAHDAFSQFCEDLWRGLPGFRWQSSLRTWSYTLARNALCRQRAASQRHGPHLALSDAPELAGLAAHVRTATPESRRTETRARFAALRERLDPDDHTLLILRIDRRMPWHDIAEILGGPAEPAALRRRAAALRKRFERLKVTLREHLRRLGDEP